MQRLSGLQIVLWLPLTRWQKVGRKLWLSLLLWLSLSLSLFLFLFLFLFLSSPSSSSFFFFLVLCCSFFAFPEDSWGEIRTISSEALGSKQSTGELCELCILDISLRRSFEVKVRSENTSLRVYVCQFAMRRLLQGFGNL